MRIKLLPFCLATFLFASAAFAESSELPKINYVDANGTVHVLNVASSVCYNPDMCAILSRETDADRIRAGRYSLEVLDARNDLVKIDENVVLPPNTLINQKHSVEAEQVAVGQGMPQVTLSDGSEVYAASSFCILKPDDCPLLVVPFDADALRSKRRYPSLDELNRLNDLVLIDDNVFLPAFTLINIRHELSAD